VPRTAAELTVDEIIAYAKVGKQPSKTTGRLNIVEKYDGLRQGLRLRVTGENSASWRWGGIVKRDGKAFPPPMTIRDAYRKGWTKKRVEAERQKARDQADEWAAQFRDSNVTPQKLAAEKKRQRIESDRLERLADEKQVPTLREYIGKWTEDGPSGDYAEHVSNHPTGKAIVERITASFFEWTVPTKIRDGEARAHLNLPLQLGGWPITAIDQDVATAWKTQALKKKAIATVKRDLGALHAALNPEPPKTEPCPGLKTWLATSKFKVKGLKVPKGRHRYLLRGSKGEDNEYERLMTALDAREEKLREERRRYNEHRDSRGLKPYPDLDAVEFVDYLKPIMFTLLFTGLRKGELAALTWKHIDFARDMVHVGALDSKKNESGRSIPMDSRLVEALKAWKAQTKQIGWVFSTVNDSAKPLTATSFRTAWRTIMGAAKIEDFTPHSCRHTFCSWLAQAGVDLYRIAEWAGHSSVTVTQIYAHLQPQDQKDALRHLG